MTEIVSDVVFMGPTQEQMDAEREKILALKNQAYMRKVQAEYDEFREVRQFVIDNSWRLIGRYVPIEAVTVDLNRTYECISINDMPPTPFHEARDMIAYVMDEKKHSYEAWKKGETLCLKAEIEKQIMILLEMLKGLK